MSNLKDDIKKFIQFVFENDDTIKYDMHDEGFKQAWLSFFPNVEVSAAPDLIGRFSGELSSKLKLNSGSSSTKTISDVDSDKNIYADDDFTVTHDSASNRQVSNYKHDSGEFIDDEREFSFNGDRDIEHDFDEGKLCISDICESLDRDNVKRFIGDVFIDSSVKFDVNDASFRRLWFEHFGDTDIGRASDIIGCFCSELGDSLRPNSMLCESTDVVSRKVDDSLVDSICEAFTELDGDYKEVKSGVSDSEVDRDRNIELTSHKFGSEESDGSTRSVNVDRKPLSPREPRDFDTDSTTNISYKGINFGSVVRVHAGNAIALARPNSFGKVLVVHYPSGGYESNDVDKLARFVKVYDIDDVSSTGKFVKSYELDDGSRCVILVKDVVMDSGEIGCIVGFDAAGTFDDVGDPSFGADVGDLGLAYIDLVKFDSILGLRGK